MQTQSQEKKSKSQGSSNARAEQTVGNWRTFESFAWWDAPEDKELWCLLPACHRDSSARVIRTARKKEQVMQTFDEDFRYERHHHWAVGWIEMFAIRVFTDATRKTITPAFKRWCRLTRA